MNVLAPVDGYIRTFMERVIARLPPYSSWRMPSIDLSLRTVEFCINEYPVLLTEALLEGAFRDSEVEQCLISKIVSSTARTTSSEQAYFVSDVECDL